MTPSLWITIALFAIGLLASLLKYIVGLDKRFETWIGRFDERSTSISQHLKKIDDTLHKMANVDSRIGFLEEEVADHEGRLRKIELG